MLLCTKHKILQKTGLIVKAPGGIAARTLFTRTF